jgi:predicted nucleic acid-binding protein
MAVRTRVLELPDALQRLGLARSLGVRSIATSSLWEGALVRAVASGVAAYDTLFVELAERERVPLATFDARVIDAFPAIARRPAAIAR